MKKLLCILSVSAMLLASLTACSQDKKSSSQPSSETPSISLPAVPESVLPAEESPLIPNVATDDYEIPQNEGIEFATKLGCGWNLGNAFDASDCTWLNDELEYESAWCGQKTTPELIAAIKAAGFSSIRVPVSWHNHVSGENFTISEEWLARVKEVVDICLAYDLYVIINIHHDFNEDFIYPDSAHLSGSTLYLTSIWTQLAETFKDYDDRLVFESLNEPRLIGHPNEWWIDPSNNDCKDAISCINSLNQTFVEVVRSSGGNNATRFLMVPGYAASYDGACNPGFILPADNGGGSDRIIVSVHAYIPYSYALEKNGTDKWSIDANNDKNVISDFMDKLYAKFVSEGVPVVIGEFGTVNKNENLESRVQHAAYYVAQARSRGMSCFWWDNNAFSGDGENLGIIDRASAEYKYPEIVQAMLKYGE